MQIVTFEPDGGRQLSEGWIACVDLVDSVVAAAGDVSRVSRREIGRTYRHVANELGIELSPADPREYLPRFCSAIGVSEQVRATATGIIDDTVETGRLSGKSPVGVAGAAIYTATLCHDEDLTQRAVARVAEVTELTIRKRYQEQVDILDPCG